MKVFFRDKLKSYCLVIALGILAGLSVVLFIELQTIAMVILLLEFKYIRILDVFNLFDCFI